MNFEINDIRKSISITVIKNQQFLFKHLRIANQSILRYFQKRYACNNFKSKMTPNNQGGINNRRTSFMDVP